MLRVLLVDFNSYFASVEQQLNPAWRGRPVGVVPVMTDSSSCIAASYEAKAFGVRTGTRVADAKRLCPDIVLVLADHAKYVRVHQQAVAVGDRVGPVQQVLSIDEMACELSGRWRERERAVALAQQLKAALLRALKGYAELTGTEARNTLIDIDGLKFYGPGYEDHTRVPADIAKLGGLGWAPVRGMNETLRSVMGWYLDNKDELLATIDG